MSYIGKHLDQVDAEHVADGSSPKAQRQHLAYCDWIVDPGSYRGKHRNCTCPNEGEMPPWDEVFNDDYTLKPEYGGQAIIPSSVQGPNILLWRTGCPSHGDGTDETETRET